MLNSFNKRVQRINFAMNPDSIVKDVMSVLVKGPINQKKLDLFRDYLFMGNEWNLSKKFIESEKGKEWIKKISDAYKSVIDKLVYDYILTDDYFLFVNDTKEYNKLMELIYGPEEAKFQSYSPDINYFVGGIWDGNDSDLQGSGKDVNKAIEDYNKNCNLYLKKGYLQVVHRWEGKSAKGKVKAIPPQVTPEQVVSGKYNFSKVDIEKCLDAMSDKQLNNPEEAIGLLMIKFKLSKEDAERYYHGYCGDKEFSNRVKKCFSLIYHVRLTDRNDGSKSVSVDNLEAGSWQEALDKVISEHPEFGLKPGDYEGSDTVEVAWNYDGDTLKS